MFKMIAKGPPASLARAVSVMVLCLAGSDLARAQAPPDQEYFLSSGGRQRRYLVHLPAGYDGSRPLPVVLGFHGRCGRAESFRTQSRMNDVADCHRFLAVYPDGTGPLLGLSWNSGPNGGGYAVQNDVDDVGFVRALLAALAAAYPVDPKRVYATGMSNGAAFCHRLGMELSDRIAAIGPVAGTRAINDPPPPRAVPIIEFHGMRDPLVPYSWVPYTINWWKKVDHCQWQPVGMESQPDYVAIQYAPPPGAAGAPVILYALPEGGHTWPGGVDVTAGWGTGNLVTTVDASTIIWAFFAQFTLNGPVTAP